MGRIDTLIDTLEVLDATGHIAGKPFQFDMSTSQSRRSRWLPTGDIAVICRYLSEEDFSISHLTDISTYLDIPDADADAMWVGVGTEAFDLSDILVRDVIDMLKIYHETGIVDWSHVEA